MYVTWKKILPRWAGIACAVFGFANIVGALVKLSEMTFPGIVVGSVWVTVGLMSGLPLFATAPQSSTSATEKIAQGLRTIRRRRLLAFGCALAWLPIAVTILPRVPAYLIGTVFFMTTFPIGAVFIVWALSACPRCDQYFLPVSWRPRFASLSRCHNCGLSLRDAEPGKDAI